VKHRLLGASGLPVSQLGLGTMTFGSGADAVAAGRSLDCFLDAGGTLVDTADIYGGGVSESMLGRLLGPRRQRVVLATKVMGAMGTAPLERGLSRRHVLEGVDASLRRLRTDWIDLYQVHFWDEIVPIDETLAALDACVRAGKVRYLGASNFGGWQLALASERQRAAGYARFVALQNEYSLVERGSEREALPAARALGVGLLPWSPLAGGALSGKYGADAPPPADSRGVASPDFIAVRLTARTRVVLGELERIARASGRTVAQAALNWVLHAPGVTAPLVGARTAAQLQESLGALDWALGDDDRAVLDAASAPHLGYPERTEWSARHPDVEGE
jgi:aryl-alcohol dehydrogenase-like predicted oxidoreductase